MPPGVDPVKDWFIKKVVLPRTFVINAPGFITGRYVALVGLGHFSRHVFLPESFIGEVETRVYRERGEDGLKELYSIAKVATWRFSKIMGIPTKQNQSIEKIAPLLFKFLETMYAKEIETKVDPTKRLLTIKAKEMAVCRKNGLGYFLPMGCLAGLWSYVCEDKNIESVQTECQGRKNKECLLYSGPAEFLENPMKTNSFELSVEDRPYESLNAPVVIDDLSLEKLIGNYYFKYNSGLLEMWGERFFPFELGYLYMLEEGMKRLGIEHVLYDCSFDFYKQFSKNLEKKSPEFSDSFACALGWGKVTSYFGKSTRAQIEHYPWCKMFDKNSSFPIISGTLSGLSSGTKDKDIKLKLKKTSLMNNLTLVFEEI